MNETENEHETAAEDAPQVDAGTETENADGAPAEDAETLSAQLDDLCDRLLRAVADADNTRKRAEKDVRDTREYAVSAFAKDMLDVADNLSRALTSVDMDNASEDMKALVEGVSMTERSLLSKMERHGVVKIDPAPGDAFDPHQHQAVAQIPSDQATGKIASVMQTGFVIGSRTLRAAMVAVSSGPAGGSEPPADETGGNLDVKA